MFILNINTVLSVDDNTVLSVYSNPSTRQDAESVRQEVLFNIDGVCSRRDAGNQSEVGFGVSAEDSCDRRNFAASRDRI